MRTKPVSIEAISLFLVEGRSAHRFFAALARSMGITDIQFHDFGGRSELAPLIRSLKAVPGFSNLRSLVVVLDAETSAIDSIHTVQGALNRGGFTAPKTPSELIGNAPAVGYFVLPNNADPGMLEDLCLMSVVEDERLTCVDEYFSCVKSVANLPNNMSKAKAHCYLAAMSNPELRVGEAADAGYWNWESPAFEQVKTLIFRSVETKDL